MIRLTDILETFLLEESHNPGQVWQTSKGYGGKNIRGKVAYFYGDRGEEQAKEWANGISKTVPKNDPPSDINAPFSGETPDMAKARTEEETKWKNRESWEWGSGWGGKHENRGVAYFYGEDARYAASFWSVSSALVNPKDMPHGYIVSDPPDNEAEIVQQFIENKRELQQGRDAEIALKKSQKPALEGVDPEHQSTLKSYTGIFYDPINAVLRDLFDYTDSFTPSEMRAELQLSHVELINKYGDDEFNQMMKEVEMEYTPEERDMRKKEFIAAGNAFNPDSKIDEGRLRAYMKRQRDINNDIYHAKIKQFTRRHREKVINDMVETRSAHLDAVIAQMPPLEKKTRVYRGVNMDVFKMLSKEDEFQDAAFVSTSISEDQARGFGGYILFIDLPAGAKVVYPNAHELSDHASEKEVILPRDSKFRIVSVGNGNNMRVELVVGD